MSASVKKKVQAYVPFGDMRQLEGKLLLSLTWNILWKFWQIRSSNQKVAKGNNDQIILVRLAAIVDVMSRFFFL